MKSQSHRKQEETVNDLLNLSITEYVSSDPLDYQFSMVNPIKSNQLRALSSMQLHPNIKNKNSTTELSKNNSPSKQIVDNKIQNRGSGCPKRYQSFMEVSDWSNRNKHVNQSFVLPAIKVSQFESSGSLQKMDNMLIQLLKLRQDQEQLKKKSVKKQSFYPRFVNSIKQRKQVQTKSIDIKFGLPQRAKNYQRSFYESPRNPDCRKVGDIEKKAINLNEYMSLQQQQRASFYNSNQDDSKQMLINIQKHGSSSKSSVINRIMNRKTRKNRTLFLQEYLTSNRINTKNGQSEQKQENRSILFPSNHRFYSQIKSENKTYL